ncbi:MAG TPA: AmmeMemoRadiSam system radical SAM enzyme [Bacteroidales bacterium]|nr:AmmeMemoRadiSam system radical SAM enzyme [Bacteroidales bacterium]
MIAGSSALPDGIANVLRESSASADTLWKWSKECTFREETPRGIKCQICPNECILKPGDTSYCRNRINYRGKLYSIAYGNPCAVHVDPIEKKPFYHFYPGSRSFSIATAGCNFACLNCQNWTISQVSPKKTRNYDLMPAAVSDQTAKNSCISVAYTYSEPITFYEYVYDSSLIARSKGLKNVVVSNGYINEKPLRHLCKVLDGATVDIKSFDDNTYVRLNAGSLFPVLNALKIFLQEGVWLEISNLVIPQWSDNPDMIRKMCDWLYDNGFSETPLHFLRFQPMYKLTQLPPTPVQVLQQCASIAEKAGLKFVYVGNVPGADSANTRCPGCGKVVIARTGHIVTENNLNHGNCRFCGAKIAGRWN